MGGMVHLCHRFGGPRGTTFNLVQSCVRTHDILLARTNLRHGTLDEDLFCRHAQRHWLDARMVLRGRVEASDERGSSILRPGDLILNDRFRGRRLRSLSRDVDMLRVCWRRGGALDDALGGRSRAHRVGPDARSIDDETRDRALAVATALEADTTHAAHRDQEIAGLLRRLRRHGAALAANRWPLMAANSSAADERVGRAIEQVLTPLSQAPAAIDLATALGCGERQALRLANRYFKRLHITVGSWREYLVGLRVALGTTAMSHPLARTDSVATWLGFSSATSFCHAFSSVGLPAPGSLAARARRSA